MNGSRSRWWVRSALLAAVMVAGACAGDGEVSEPAPTSTAPTSTPDSTTTVEPAPSTAAPDTEPPPTTTAQSADTISWGSCSGFVVAEYAELAPSSVFECATVTVPLDHSGVVPGTIDLAVTVLRASDPEPIGALFVNPGGPGVAPADLLAGFALGGLPDDLRSRFDIVGLDPRGVGDSEPSFGCGPTEEIDELLDTIEGIPDTDEEAAAGEAAARLCVDRMGPVAGYMGSRDVADDMDLVREAMGEETISYLGFSYGSTLGVMYAARYPERVRAMVVDGADNVADVVETPDDLVEELFEEAQPFEDQLGLALDSCSPSCPFGDDPVAAIVAAGVNAALLDELFDGREGAFTAAIVGTLYDEGSWPDLHQGLVDLAAGDPSTLEPYAAINFGPGETDPTITAHVNCIDSWIVDDTTREEVYTLYEEAFGDGREEELIARFPLLDALSQSDEDADLAGEAAGGAGICTFYDSIIGDRLAGPLVVDEVPVVVIGNRSDPFTPFGESEELVDEVLVNGVLVEVDHPRHTVYPQNPCVVDIVHAALIDGVVPPAGTVCEESTAGATDDLNLLCRIILDFSVADGGLDAPEDPDGVCEQVGALVREELGDDEVDRLITRAEVDEDAGIQLGQALASALVEVLVDG